MWYLLNLKSIEDDFFELKENFYDINDSLDIKRDHFSKDVMENLLQTYEYVNFLLSKWVDILDWHHNHEILELNHLVLIWKSIDLRQEYNKHIEETRKKFSKWIEHTIKRAWKKNSKWVYKVAAWIFIHWVSQPQLFIEWNHRTNTTLVNYLLLREWENPFIVNTLNAKAFFNPAQEIKRTFKWSLKETFKMLKHKKIFKDFFSKYSSSKYKINN